MEGTYACLTNVDNDQQEREKLEERGKCVNNITKVLVKKKKKKELETCSITWHICIYI